MDQNVASNDFEDGGIWWERLGWVELPAGATELRVELSTDGANGYVVADSIWGGPSSTPHLAMYSGDQRLVNGQSLIDLGFSELNPVTPVTRTFSVSNLGGADLNVDLPLVLPVGFSLVGTTNDLDLLDGALDGKVTVDPGDSFDFQLRLHAAAPGYLSDKVTLFSNDFENYPFEFQVAAQIGTQLVDNDDPGFKLGYGPSPFQLSQDPRYAGGDVRFHAAGRGTNWVDWEFKGLTPGSFYQVSTTWVTGPDRASNAPYLVFGGTNISPLGTPLASTTVDQRIAPNDYQDRDLPWENLLVVGVPAGKTALTVRLTDKADGWVYGDAVRIEQVYLPKVEVTIGGQLYDSGEAFDFGRLLDSAVSTTPVTVKNVGTLPLYLGPIQLNTTGGVLLTSTWPGGNLQGNQTMTFNIGLDTTPLATDNDRTFTGEIYFSTTDVTAPRFSLPVQGTVTDFQVIDNDAAGFSVLSGSDFELRLRDTQYYGDDVHFAPAGQGSNVVQWEFSGLTNGVTYLISATWAGGDNRATNAPYRIIGSTTINVPVNQQLAPNGTGGGSIWQRLTPITAQNGKVLVQLSDNANGWVAADAIRLDVPDPPPLLAAGEALAGVAAAPLTLDTVQPLLADAIALWQSTGLTAAESAKLAGVEVIIAQLPGAILGQASLYDSKIWLDTNAAGHGWQGEVRGQRLEVRGSRERGAWSREQGAWSRERGAWSRERGAGSVPAPDSRCRHFRIPIPHSAFD